MSNNVTHMYGCQLPLFMHPINPKSKQEEKKKFLNQAGRKNHKSSGEERKGYGGRKRS